MLYTEYTWECPNSSTEFKRKLTENDQGHQMLVRWEKSRAHKINQLLSLKNISLQFSVNNL